MSELQHVPTVLELAAQGHARPVHVKSGVAYVIDEQGQTLMRAAMKHNAKIGQLEDETRIANTARQRFIWEMHNGRSTQRATPNVPHDKRARQETAA